MKTVRESQSANEAALIWKGRKSAFGATGRIADYICMDGTVPLSQLAYVLKKTSEIIAHYAVFHTVTGMQSEAFVCFLSIKSIFILSYNSLSSICKNLSFQNSIHIFLFFNKEVFFTLCLWVITWV